MLDWELATLAEPHFDIARTSSILRMVPGPMSSIGRRIVQRLGSRSASRFLAAYLERASVDTELLDWVRGTSLPSHRDGPRRSGRHRRRFRRRRERVGPVSAEAARPPQVAQRDPETSRVTSENSEAAPTCRSGANWRTRRSSFGIRIRCASPRRGSAVRCYCSQALERRAGAAVLLLNHPLNVGPLLRLGVRSVSWLG